MIRVLLADDDDAMRDFLARALARSGYGVESVDRGTTALEKIQADTERDYYMSAAEAQTYGLIDQVLSKRA